MKTIIGECSKHPGRSMIDCPACAIEEIKKRKPLDEILFPAITDMCDSHTPKVLLYIQQIAWAEKQAKKGLKQTQCKKCKRWFFPSEF